MYYVQADVTPGSPAADADQQRLPQHAGLIVATDEGS
jgi:hypothetical protein